MQNCWRVAMHRSMVPIVKAVSHPIRRCPKGISCPHNQLNMWSRNFRWPRKETGEKGNTMESIGDTPQMALVVTLWAAIRLKLKTLEQHEEQTKITCIRQWYNIIWLLVELEFMQPNPTNREPVLVYSISEKTCIYLLLGKSK